MICNLNSNEVNDFYFSTESLLLSSNNVINPHFKDMQLVEAMFGIRGPVLFRTLDIVNSINHLTIVYEI